MSGRKTEEKAIALLSLEVMKEFMSISDVVSGREGRRTETCNVTEVKAICFGDVTDIAW